MKQLSILTSLAVLAAATACTVKEQEEVLPVIPQYEEFYATIEQPSETDTKTYADDRFRVLWHADDRITIFNRYTYNQQYAFQGETGDNAGGFSKVGDDDFVTGNDLPDIYAVYPYQKSTKISNDGVITVTLPAEQTWAEGSFGAGSNTMISATSDNKLKFRNTGSILAFKLYGSNVQVSNIILQGNNGERIAGKATVTMPVGGSPSVAMQSDATQSITLSCATPVTIGTSAGSYTEFWFVVPPTDFTRGFTITVTSADGGTFEKATDKSVSLARNHIYRMAPIEVVPQKPAAVPEYVDLGLSVKWATFNLGATKPEEYGDYFAWGETEPYYESGYAHSNNPIWKTGKENGYSWAIYKWCNGAYNKLTKYCTPTIWDSTDQCYYWDSANPVDNKTILDPEDDAAHVNWGGSWRMPTSEEQKELLDNCIWTWTTNYNGTGIAGRIVTSNIPGYTDKSIFLPAAGNRYDTSLGLVGSAARYWSSSLNTGYPRSAWFVHFSSDYVNNGDGGYRIRGFPIRPVYGEFTPVESLSLDKISLELNVKETYQLTATISPSNATAKDVHWASSDQSVAWVSEGLVTAVASGTATITAYGSSGVSAECMVTVLTPPDDYENGYEYVDLGLPSGLKWATMNVGATKPEEYGDYFAWGETEPKSNYDWSTYKFQLGTDYNGPFSKYVFDSGLGTGDNKTVLDPEDDAAHVNWGGNWRMPTDAEWMELMNCCTWTLTTENGVYGLRVAGNKTGYTDKSIFFPAAGSRRDADSYAVGSYGYYWSSSLNLASSNLAWLALFTSGLFDRSSQYSRCLGRPVRPVYGEFIPVASISLDKTSLELIVNDTYQLTATISPSNATAKDIRWVSSDTDVATVDATGLVTVVAAGTATITAYGSSGVSAECMVTVVKVDLSLPASVEAVDLGLPSGLKWATMNVGASAPEEYGEYFAWGETEPKTDYSWSTYKFWVSGDGNWDGEKYNLKINKYCNQSSYWDSSDPMDNKTVLDPEDDAAHVNWGGSWRMPTDEEWKELMDNCTWTRTTQNGVNGRLVTGPNGKSIFLPAAGFRDDTYLGNAWSYGIYWSSSLYTDNPSGAYSVIFNFDNVYWGGSRFPGFSVRAVTE